MSDMTFDGMTVLMTGASGGFGKSATRMFAERGARLVLSDVNETALKAHAEALQADGFEVVTITGSVADEAHCQATVDLAMETFGRLDVAINNAGMSHNPGKVHEVDSARAQDTIQINLMGVFYGMKHQIPAMLAGHQADQQTRSILNLASLAGIGGAPTMSMYAAAKHGVVGLTKSAALEYARKGLRINCLCPSFARTPIVTEGLLDGSDEDAEKEKFLTRGIPMRRLAEPEEITQSMLWICDPKNSFMTGQAVALDGGTSAMGR
ncbi:MAG: SDR family NAD(P)-dependent oxidoreductase [Ahrensia sp.]|nr:SDR family NAD(P)-dependent oxidoreductase [Ahrensia sp.]